MCCQHQRLNSHEICEVNACSVVERVLMDRLCSFVRVWMTLRILFVRGSDPQLPESADLQLGWFRAHKVVKPDVSEHVGSGSVGLRATWNSAPEDFDHLYNSSDIASKDSKINSPLELLQEDGLQLLCLLGMGTYC